MKKDFKFLRRTQDDWAPQFLLQLRSHSENWEIKRAIHTAAQQSMHPNPADSDNSNFEDANSISQNTIDDEIMDQVNVPSDNDPQYHGSYSCRFFLSLLNWLVMLSKAMIWYTPLFRMKFNIFRSIVMQKKMMT